MKNWMVPSELSNTRRKEWFKERCKGILPPDWKTATSLIVEDEVSIPERKFFALTFFNTGALAGHPGKLLTEDEAVEWARKTLQAHDTMVHAEILEATGLSLQRRCPPVEIVDLRKQVSKQVPKNIIRTEPMEPFVDERDRLYGPSKID